MRFGLRMGPDGFVNLREMLSIDHGRFFAGFTERDVVRVVRSNVKKRFSLSEDERAEYLVRANQGHTMGAVEDESLLVDVCQGELEHRGEVCVHGTYWNCWEAIKREGLRTKGRNHIHFAPRAPDGDEEVICGMRSNCEIMIYLDIPKALKAGMQLLRSSNNVLLTRGIRGVVAPEFFLRAAQRWPWKILWPERNMRPKLEDVPRKLQRPRQTETEVVRSHEVPETWDDLEPRDVPENWDDIPSPAHMTDVAGGISEKVVLRFPVTASIECQEAPQRCKAETREVTHQENDSCTWTAEETRVEPPPRSNAQSHEDSRNDQGGRDGDPAWSASPRAVDSKGASSGSVTTTNQTETVKTDDKKKKKRRGKPQKKLTGNQREKRRRENQESGRGPDDSEPDWDW